MSRIPHPRLAAKVNATFLLLLGLFIITDQLATWAGTGQVYPVDKIIFSILGLIPLGLAVYIMRDLSPRTTLLKWLMGVLVLLSCIFTFSMLYLYFNIGVYDQSFFEATSGAATWPPQIICALLFVWLMIENPKKSNQA